MRTRSVQLELPDGVRVSFGPGALSATHGDVLRAIIEGLAYALREGAERTVKRSKVPIAEIRGLPRRRDEPRPIGLAAGQLEVPGDFLEPLPGEEDYFMSARLTGIGAMRVIFRDILPAMTSHLIASLTLSVPGMILGETSLSFLGLGLRPPVVSWGVLLRDGQSLQAMALSPWLAFVPGLFIVIAVISFQYLGDGLRDAADPYAR